MKYLRVIFVAIAIVGFSLSGYGQQSGLPASAAQTAAQFGGSAGCPFLTYSGGCSSSTTATQWGFNAVSDEGMSTGGSASANASALSTFLNSALAQAGPLMIPCGTYALNPVTVSATNSTKGLITVIGANKTSWIGGSSCVTFNCTALSADCLWFDNSSTNAGNQLGIRLEHLNFTDGSGGVGAHSGLRITQYNNVQLTDISAQNFLGTHVTAGTCSVTNGSTAVTGSGTSWPTAATDGHLWVGGTGPTVGGVATADFQEIASVNSATSITLRNAWQGSTASGASCSFDYNGNGFEFDGGSGFAQYWDLRGLGGYNNRVWMFTPGGATSSEGVSRFNIYSGFNNCHGNSGSNPNTIAMTFGNYSDVHRIDNDVNNCAVGIDDEGAHALVIGSFHNENVSTSEPIVNVCNGGVQSEACSIGVNFASGFMVSDFTSLGTYLIKTGIAFKFNGNPINLEKAKIMGSLFQDYGTSGTENDLNYWFGDGTTCQTQSIVTVVNDDCTNLQGPSLTVNGLQWLNGSGAPSGSCTTGSFYSNTSGTSGTTLYACVSSAWVDIK